MLHQIGVGALGPVYRTYEPARDRLVAVKVFRLDIVPEQARALADELNRASEAGLFHPSVVEPIAAGVEGTVAYRAEEYVAAESLDVAMRHYAPAPIDKALPFITQLAGAIDFARAAGVGHGSLHPRDIFVTPDEARATGFGVVEALERVGIRAPVRRPYSPPERIEGVAWGTSADVFALAAIAFELFTGRRPAGTGTEIGPLTGSHLTDTASALQAVLARAMRDDPARRYNSALAFAGALESAARGESEAAARMIPSPQPSDRASPSIGSVERDPAIAAGMAGVPVSAHQELARDRDQSKELEADEQASVEAERSADEAFEPTLFDDEPVDPGMFHAAGGDPEALADAAFADTHPLVPAELDDDSGRFAWDFAGEREGNARPLAAAYEMPRDEHAAGSPGDSEPEHEYAASERLSPDPDPFEPPERSKPAALPLAVMLVLGLLGGFAAGYFVGSRDRMVPPEASTAAAEQAAPATGGTPARDARPYSDQAVTSPGPAARSASPSGPQRPPAVAPEVPVETPSSSKPPSARGKTAAAPTPPLARGAAPTRGKLIVRSTPPRAAVTVNGRWRGRTPLTLENLPFGTYAIRIVQPGFRVEKQDVALTPRQATRTIAARLESDRPRATRPRSEARTSPPAAAPQPTGAGSLYVDSRPQGARILLDGKPVGKTPLRLPEVPIGTHVVRLELAEHHPWTSTTQVTAGGDARVTGSLEQIR